MERILPPVIRVFISSTFADMEHERHYFNTVIVPKLTRLCAERGVSFFSVDLRWGITKEDQINGNVLPICLREIDNCRPFFIGILGNRYGSVVENISEEMEKKIPWLNGRGGKSVTELEMLYGVLETENHNPKTNCAFYFRSDELSKQFFPESEFVEKYEKLCHLKNVIRSNDKIPSYDYDSLESFGTAVINAFIRWLNQEFPSEEHVREARKNWYNSELLRDYVDSKDMHQFIDRYCESDRRSLLITGDGLRGKTTFLTHWLPKQGKKIMINCGADESYHYWPEIAHEIVRKINEIDESYGIPQFQAGATMYFQLQQLLQNSKEGDKRSTNSPVFYVTDAELDSFRRNFVAWLQKIQLKEPIYIIINDLNLISSEESYYLNWLPVELPENLHIICSANKDMIQENAEILGWNMKEMSLYSNAFVETFLDNYMAIYGKKLSGPQKISLSRTELLQYPGYLKFIIKYLNNYGRFDNLDELTTLIGEMTSVQEIYKHVLNHIMRGMTTQEKEIVYNTLFILASTSIGLREEECYNLVLEIVPVDALTWANVRVILEQFDTISADIWHIKNTELIQVIHTFSVDSEKINSVLGNYFRNLLEQEKIARSLDTIKKNTEYAEAVIHHFTLAKDWETLCSCLENRKVLYYLTKLDWNTVRAAWVNVIMYSEINVSDRLLNLLHELKKEESKIEGVQFKIVSLLKDLEQSEASIQAAKETGLPSISELRRINENQISREFGRYYNFFCDLKEKKNFRSLHQNIQQFLKENESKLNSYEKCCIYALKLYGELQLQLFGEGIQTANKYYVEAVHSMNTHDTLMAVVMRGQCLYFLGNISSAIHNFKYAEKLAMIEGDIREYLSAVNMEAMCFYRREEYSESIRLFDICIRIWKKLNNIREMVVVQNNRCHAFGLKGDLEQALIECKKAYEAIQKLNQEERLGLENKILTNIGKYSYMLGKIEDAEAAYKKVIDQSKGNVSEQLIGSTYFNLIELYEKQQMLAKALGVYEQLLEYLYQNQHFSELATSLKKNVELLNRADYYLEAQDLLEKWKDIFRGIPNGEKLLQGVFHGVEDSLRIKQLQEQLIVAKSEDNTLRCGTILMEIAPLYKSEDCSETINAYMEASNYFEQCGNINKAEQSAQLAIYNILKSKDRVRDERIDILRTKLTPQDNTIIDLWIDVVSIAGALEEGISEVAGAEDYSETVIQIVQYAVENHILALHCLFSQIRCLAEFGTEELLLRVLDMIEDTTYYDKFSRYLSDELLKEGMNDLSYLKRDYSSGKAEKIITHYEKCVNVLKKVNSGDAASVAGNIALIFRRRRDKEKTIFYHELSMEIYQQAGKDRDYYIEVLNLATACHEFNEKSKAIMLLRNALKELENFKVSDIQASIAGNLASFLISDESASENEQEILACFEMEEKYFASVEESRELVISLLNQINYFLRKRGKYSEMLVEKYKQAEKIVKQHHLAEFVQVLRKVSRFLPKEDSEGTVNAAAKKLLDLRDGLKNKYIVSKKAEVLLQELLKKDGNFEIVEIKEQQEKQIHAVCKYKQDIPLVKVNVHIVIKNDDEKMLRCIFALQPRNIHSKTEMAMQQYVQWWNEQDDYELHIQNEGLLMLMLQEIDISDWEKAVAVFKRCSKLWSADALNVSLISMGITDLQDFQKMKLKILKEMDTK